MSSKSGSITVSDPPLANALFNTTRLSWLWLILRVYLGYEWITASLHKLSSPAWMQTGDALKGYWSNAVTIPDPPASAAITYGWYRSFLQFLLDNQSYVWFSKVIAVGEFLVGLGLIVGLFVGIAAFFGGLMNFNFMLAGSASTNPVFFLLAVLLMLAWKVAGFWGLDRWALRWLGTPWQKGEGLPIKKEASAKS